MENINKHNHGGQKSQSELVNSQYRVCHLTTAHEALDDRIFHKECKSLSIAGYDVTVIARHETNETVDGIKIIALKNKGKRIGCMLKLPLEILFKAVKQHSHIYHFHDPELLPVGVLLKILTRKTIIYDVHEDYGKQVLSKPYLPKKTRKIISLLITLIEQFSTKYFDGIITATDDILNNFVQCQEAISVKNYPVHSYFCSQLNHDINKECHNIYNIVYTGSISKERGLMEIIQAMNHIDQPVKVSIYGSISPHASDLQFDKMKGYEKVEFLGWVEHRKMLQLLSKYHAGIVCLHPLPNYVTALPIKLFEYMAAGLPVIASDFPILKEIVEGNKCGICVNPLNPEEIAGAIKYLMQHRSEAEEMGKNGRNAVVNRYNWEMENKKLSKLYGYILGI